MLWGSTTLGVTCLGYWNVCGPVANLFDTNFFRLSLFGKEFKFAPLSHLCLYAINEVDTVRLFITLRLQQYKLVMNWYVISYAYLKCIIISAFLSSTFYCSTFCSHLSPSLLLLFHSNFYLQLQIFPWIYLYTNFVLIYWFFLQIKRISTHQYQTHMQEVMRVLCWNKIQFLPAALQAWHLSKPKSHINIQHRL